MRRNHGQTPNLLNQGILDDMWESYRASCFCGITRACRLLVRICIKVHTCLQVEVDHGRGGTRSAAGQSPSESSRTRVHMQPMVTTAL